ncbi:hypothetical protein DMC63_35845 [Streptomyces sp. WAC 05977]|uniref:Uncharacterized protein n=1 Tax=Amycolatopsis keratiniphila TaxID=129921 RepID=R4SZK6_9PSEU|nr:hypothetical protein [Amycolatopsis keratiniphila]AGM07975.1 hypothetical protein AORI_5392 [Amycolatopsis keratiniphila]RSN07152.1 hypothetical protein DMC63_35845 [Streptomyces sp. WAC 05977]
MHCENDVDSKVRTLAAWLRDTDTFTGTIARWLQSPVEYSSLRHEYRPVTAEHASQLGIPVGSTVLFRRGYLEVRSLGARQPVAEVSAVVVDHRLSRDARQALDSKKVALGSILSSQGMRRHTQSVTTSSAVDGNGPQVLRVAATLTVADELVAAVNEIVYRRLFDLGRQSLISPTV